MSDNGTLSFAFHIDRDYFIPFSKWLAYAYGTFAICFLHPIVFYMLIYHSKFMNKDYRRGCIALQTSQVVSDFWMCIGYQLYPLCPYSGFLCNGFLCRFLSGRIMLTVLSFAIINICATYILLILRTHQIILEVTNSKWKLNRKVEIALRVALYSALFSNVIGFWLFSADSPAKGQDMKADGLQWTAEYIQVQYFGARGQTNEFSKEMIILAVSVLTIFPSVPFLAAQVIWELHLQKRNGQSKSQAQIGRAAINLFARFASSGLFFCLPLGFLFAGMLGIVDIMPIVIQEKALPYLRILLLSSFYVHSLPCTGAFLMLNPAYVTVLRTKFMNWRCSQRRSESYDSENRRKSLVGATYTDITEKLGASGILTPAIKKPQRASITEYK